MKNFVFTQAKATSSIRLRIKKPHKDVVQMLIVNIIIIESLLRGRSILHY